MNDTFQITFNQLNFTEIRKRIVSDAEAPFRLSMNQDLIMAMTHLISIEEHLVFTGAKTEKSAYYDLIKDLKPIQETLISDLLPSKPENFSRISRDLLAALMRLMEVGTKQLGVHHDDEANDFFKQAYQCYLLFLTYHDAQLTELVKQTLDDTFLENLNQSLRQFSEQLETAPRVDEPEDRSRLNSKKIPIENLNQFIEAADTLKKQNQLDLSSDQDLTLAIMNLIVLEEDFFFAGVSSEKQKFYALLRDMREMRKGLLKQLIQSYEGEVWCISKHLLSASMRLMNLGRALIQIEQKQKAHHYFQLSYDLYALFWGLNLGVITSGKTQEDPKAGKIKLVKKLGRLVKKAIDCCIE